jgi:hypothetical protein
MPRSRRPRIALLAVLGVTLLISSAAVAFGVWLVPPHAGLDPGSAVLLLAGLSFDLALGAIIVLRAEGHPVGWLFAIGATMLGVVFGCWALSAALASVGGSETIRAWFSVVGAMLFTPAMILILPAVAMVFPTGTLPGPRWRWPVALVAVMASAATVIILILPAPIVDDLENPVGRWFAWMPEPLVQVLGALTSLGTLAILLALILGVAAVGIRFRRSHGDERAQLKWLLAATVPAAILIPLSLSQVAAAIPFIDLASVATLSLVALAVALAVLRYRLYDIDRIISRTVSYAIVTGILAFVFVGAIIVFQALLAPVLGSNPIAVAGSTLVVAALFQPLRSRVQRVVDRRFDRSRYDAERIVSAFSAHLRDDVDLESLEADVRNVVGRTVAPASVGLWMRRSKLES